MTLTIPIRTVSELNRRGREHWTARHKRVKAQRDAIVVYWRKWWNDPDRAPAIIAPPWRITLCRIAPRKLDGHDNLQSSLKGVADQISKQLFVDDGDTSKVEWRYTQERGKSKEYAVRIEIKAKT